MQTDTSMIQGSCSCGAVQWRFDGIPESATACNCTLCRRYGALWAYDFEGQRIDVSGPTVSYVRGQKWIEFHFCAACGCVMYWRAAVVGGNGRRRMAVNLRMSEPDSVAKIPIVRHDGLVAADDLAPDGRCVADYWF